MMDFYASEELETDREEREEVYTRFREELEAEHRGEVVASTSKRRTSSVSASTGRSSGRPHPPGPKPMSTSEG